MTVITLTASSAKRNVTVWRPSVSVCPSARKQRDSLGAARDAASVHFSQV